MKAIIRFLVAGAVLAMSACDFKVTNPGPVADADLNDPGAWDAIVRGVRYNMSRAVSINAYYAAIGAKEYSTAGRVIGTKLPLNFGQLDVDDMSANGFTWSQAARWQAEDGIRRLREVLGTGFASNRIASQLLMYAALANRNLGECFCEAVIDGGARQSHTVYLTRARDLATEAIAVANAVTPNTAVDVATRQAAFAIRASARLYLGDFTNAGNDAAVANVPNTFVLTAPFDEGTQNILVQSNDFAVGGSFRATTAWRSYFESYFRTSGDLRVRWDSQAVNGVARAGEFTGIPWFFQRKYVPTLTTADRGSPIRMISGWEMRLIEAEVALRNNQLAAAMTAINSVRVRTPALAVRAGSPALTGWTATTIQEGWDALKRERSIELWLEGRTMGDLRRWIADGTYPSMFTIGPNRGGILGSENDVADRIRLCFPITRGERNTNSNLPLDPRANGGDDPKSPIFSGPGAPW